MHVSEIGSTDPLFECPVCLGAHDPDIHEATVTIHLWLRREIARRIQPEPFVILNNHIPAGVFAESAAATPLALAATR
jgi:hypothetical protein